MRRFFTLSIATTLGFLPLVIGSSGARATVAVAALGTAEKQAGSTGPVTKVWYRGCCNHGYGFGYRRPSYGYGYGYGYRRPSYGYGYGYARPYYGGYGGYSGNVGYAGYGGYGGGYGGGYSGNGGYGGGCGY